MNYVEACSCLGIPVTKDVAKIKKAYQAQLPSHHPEDDPQGFMRLHQAYKTAMVYAQKNGNIQFRSVDYSGEPERKQPSREETGYDSLFAGLEENAAAVDISREKKRFILMILWLKLHWLPVPVRTWRKFFASKTFQLCRGDEECLERLFELILRKCHSYKGLRVILGYLWELEDWLDGEGKDALAARVRGWIKEIRGQYSHYLELDIELRLDGWAYPIMWYYAALPYLFRLTVSFFLLPLMSMGINFLLIMLLIAFNIAEFGICCIKGSRNMGIYHSKIRKKKRSAAHKPWDPTGMVVVTGIYGVLIQFACCVSLMELYWT